MSFNDIHTIIKNIRRRVISEYFLLFLSSLLCTLALPAVGYNYIAFFALVPFFTVFFNKQNKTWISFVFGCLLSSQFLYFILIAKLNGYSFKMNIILFILLVFIHGVYYLCFGYLFGKIESVIRNENIINLLMACFLVGFEIICDRTYMGFHISFGISQYNNPFILTLVKYIGLYGASFIVICFNISLARVLTVFLNKETNPFSKILLNFIPIFIIIPLIFTANYNPRVNDGNSKRVCVIQGNILSDEYDTVVASPIYGEKIFEKHMSMTEKCLETCNPEVIVWPECAANIWLMRLSPYKDRLCDFAAKNQVYLMIGCPDINEDYEEFNSVFVISPQGNIVGRYDKNVCVPFTESFFRNSNENKPIVNPGMNWGVKLCYEAVFPQLSAKLARENAEVLFFLSNNLSFGYTSEPYIMLAVAAFRAAENSKTVVQAANNGYSAIISPEGKIVGVTGLFTEDTVNGEVILSSKKTFYSMYGDTLYLILSIIVCLFVTICAFIGKLRENSTRRA